MFTEEQIDLLERIANDGSFEGADQKNIIGILVNCREPVKPQILVTIKGGAVQSAHANMDIELVLADMDNIEQGDDLEYVELDSITQEEFDDAVQRAYEKVLLARKPYNRLKEIGIFVHDPEDEFPFKVQVNGDAVIASYKTFDEALRFLNLYSNTREK